MVDSRAYNLPDNVDTTGFYFTVDKDGAPSLQRLPVSYITDITDPIKADVAKNEADIADNAAAIVVNSQAIADIPSKRGLLVYSARVNLAGATVTSNEHINDSGNGLIYVTEFTVSGSILRINIRLGDSRWEEKLEIQATSNPQTTSSINRNLHFFYEDPYYISCRIVDTSGNSQDGSFWIRIYKWG